MCQLVARTTMPVFMGYISIGIPFGLLIVNAGYPWWIAPLMAIAMYTGAGQFFAVGLFVSGAPLSVIILAEFLLSIRHIFYALSLIERYKPLGWWRPYLMYSITDETFALVASSDVPEVFRGREGLYYTLVSCFDQFYWFMGCFIGAVAYGVLQKWNLTRFLSGIDFSLTTLFVVLLVEQVKKSRDYAGALCGAAACLFTVLLFKAGRFDSSGIIWVSICVALVLVFVLRGKSYVENSRAGMEEGLDSISPWGIGVALCLFAAFVFLMLALCTPGTVQPTAANPLTLSQALVAVFCSGAVVVATRVVPFVVFNRRKIPLAVRFIEKYSTTLIMAVLLVYCFKDPAYSVYPYGIPFAACAALSIVIHLLFRNSMVSIFGVTVVYMVAIRFFA